LISPYFPHLKFSFLGGAELNELFNKYYHRNISIPLDISFILEFDKYIGKSSFENSERFDCQYPFPKITVLHLSFFDEGGSTSRREARASLPAPYLV
jgi:hypothetical protein